MKATTAAAGRFRLGPRSGRIEGDDTRRAVSVSAARPPPPPAPVRTRCFDPGSGGEPLLAQFGRAYVSPRVLRENVVDGSEDGVDADDGIVASDLFELLS